MLPTTLCSVPMPEMEINTWSPTSKVKSSGTIPVPVIIRHPMGKELDR